jgi:hypothetical protein
MAFWGVGMIAPYDCRALMAKSYADLAVTSPELECFLKLLDSFFKKLSRTLREIVQI